MKRSFTFAALLLLPALLVGCLDRPNPGSDIAPVLSGEEALASFRLPEGFRIELVAAEPLVRDPVAMEFDADGRLWVVEMPGYMPDLYDEGANAPIGRIVILEDRDSDGEMDRRTVFMDSLVLARAVKVLEEGVLVASPPWLWLVRDTDGDLRSDTREVVRSDYGDLEANVEHNANGLLWGIDNWIHNTIWGGQLRYRNGAFEYREMPSQGQWGISTDEFGRLFRNGSEDPLRAELVSAHYTRRNPNLPSVRGTYEQLTSNVPVYPARPTPGINRGYRPQTMREDSTLAHYTAAGAPHAVTGDRLPAELRRQVFVTEPVGNLVGRLELTVGADGIPEANRIDGETDFLTSTDERFRPVNFANGPDGTLYVVDMYRGVIQHRFFMTDYLEQIILARGLDSATGHGRIYRIVHESLPPRRENPEMGDLTSAELVPFLSHPNGWHRMTAQQRIVERGEAAVAPAVREVLSTAADERARLHAIWTLEGIGAVDSGSLNLALADPSPHVRAAALRISEEWLPSRAEAILPALLALVDDEDPIVRAQLAAALGELPTAEGEVALARLIALHGDDPLLPDLAVSGLAGREVTFLERLLALPSGELPEETGATTMRVLASTILRGRDPVQVERLIGWATQGSRPEWQRAALLTPRPNPGGRGGGPGGGIRLASAPRALIALAEGGQGPMAQGARSIAGLVDWPGKPEPVNTNTVAPLNPEQMERFAAGEQTFSSVCAACHGSEGEGVPGAGKPLAGSPWVVTRPIEVMRILLHGKEGEAEMPALGNSLDDEAIANVLTYIRRAWGHTASPVNPGQVTEVRGATTGRDRPYTEDELRAAR